jgi:hypothetical protein
MNICSDIHVFYDDPSGLSRFRGWGLVEEPAGKEMPEYASDPAAGHKSGPTFSLVLD